MKINNCLIVGALLTGALLVACGGDDDTLEPTSEPVAEPVTGPEPDPLDWESLKYYYWQDRPQSYIRMFDKGFDFQLTRIMRHGTDVEIDYTITNVNYADGIKLDVCGSDTQPFATDDKGNTYYLGKDNGRPVKAYMNGNVFGVYGSAESFVFKKDIPVEGVVSIRNFNTDATEVSFDIYAISNVFIPDFSVSRRYRDVSFVNIPLAEGEDNGPFIRKSAEEMK